MIHFYKYQGTGNDFIIIDNRHQKLILNTTQIALLCHRKYGIGADGLMLLEEATGYDFRMVYYNADGKESTMCGNGGRCISAFARHLKLSDKSAYFIAIDGEHHAEFIDENLIALQMNNVLNVEHFDSYSVLNTGSPHFVLNCNSVEDIDVFHQGREIRNRPMYAPNGINVNFVAQIAKGLFVRTYERGVEDETLSCGTGVTACAIASTNNQTGSFKIDVETLGGKLIVAFTKNTASTAQNVILTGPASFVFEGDYQL